jgi:hypothetical protein
LRENALKQVSRDGRQCAVQLAYLFPKIGAAGTSFKRCRAFLATFRQRKASVAIIHRNMLQLQIH